MMLFKFAQLERDLCFFLNRYIHTSKEIDTDISQIVSCAGVVVPDSKECNHQQEATSIMNDHASFFPLLYSLWLRKRLLCLVKPKDDGFIARAISEHSAWSDKMKEPGISFLEREIKAELLKQEKLKTAQEQVKVLSLQHEILNKAGRDGGILPSNLQRPKL